MEKAIRDLWWVPIVRGFSAVAFGILILVWPNADESIVALLFASILTLYSITDIIVGAQTLTRNFSGMLRLLLGFFEVGITVFLLNHTVSISFALLGQLMAVVLVVLAIVLSGIALMGSNSAAYRWTIGLAGAMTLFIGITVARAPVISMATVVWVLGLYGLIVGSLEIAAGLMLKDEPVARN